jgi:hypothetical protein
MVRTGVEAHNIAQVSVCASGAVPPAVGATGKAVPANDAPVAVTIVNARAVLGAVVNAVHIASKSDDVAPQSARRFMFKVH